jgi:phospholipid transport system substrate-binding protein
VTTRYFLKAIALVLYTGLLGGTLPAKADTGPAEFVRQLGNEALEVMRADTTAAQKEQFFHQLLRQDFDTRSIAQFVLGPYWRAASEAERQEFRKLFEDYIVRVYSKRFAQYHGEALNVTSSRADSDGAIVASEIVRPNGGTPIKVDWRLGTRDGLYKVTDVIIDGISMAVSDRSQFASVIQRTGGQVQGLLAMMRDKSVDPVDAAPAAVPRQ